MSAKCLRGSVVRLACSSGEAPWTQTSFYSSYCFIPKTGHKKVSERGHVPFTVVVFTTLRLQFLGIREWQKIFLFLFSFEWPRGAISASQTADVEMYPGDQANTGSILNRSNNRCFAKPDFSVWGLRQVSSSAFPQRIKSVLMKLADSARDLQRLSCFWTVIVHWEMTKQTAITLEKGFKKNDASGTGAHKTVLVIYTR